MKYLKKKASTDDLINAVGCMIYTGPFAGLKIPTTIIEKLTVSEILGLYESCLHERLHTLINKDIEKMIVVGGNNGYYPAGFFHFLNPKQMKVYEMITDLHPMIESWFHLNNFALPEIHSKATIAEFNNVVDMDFMFMDCEGFEVELLNPESFPWQVNAEIIFELHHFYVDKLLSTITSRFRSTHIIKIIYDSPYEDILIEKILNGFKLNLLYNSQPTHRWIIKANEKVYTSGIFLHLIPKN